MKNHWIEIGNRIKEVYNNQEIIPLHEPTFTGNEKVYLNDCIESGWVSSVGEYVNRFEEKLAEFIGVKRAIAVVNGTAALHIALKLVGVETDDEVLIPSITFVATANAVNYCGGIPHFIDIEERTLGLDPFKLEQYLVDISEQKDEYCYNKYTKRRIKAIVPMHTFGHPVDLNPIIEICKKYHLELVEDAAESLGSYYKNRHTGTFGKVSALSFNGNKIITTGGGGAILTNDEEIANKAKHITTTAKVPHRWEFNHDKIGYNYRMPNLNAALGCAQLEQLPHFLKNKRRIAEKYAAIFDGFYGLTFKREEETFARSNYWLNTLILDQNDKRARDELLQILNDMGVMARPIWKPMHHLSMYKDCPKMDLSMSELLMKRIINIPSSVPKERK